MQSRQLRNNSRSSPAKRRPMTELRLIGLDGIPDIHPGDDLVQIIGDAVERTGEALQAGDILVVTHKIVSKAEGRLVHLAEVTPSTLAQKIAGSYDKDPRQVEVVLREVVRIVRMD